jgi:hypothetical protein
VLSYYFCVIKSRCCNQMLSHLHPHSTVAPTTHSGRCTSSSYTRSPHIQLLIHGQILFSGLLNLIFLKHLPLNLLSIFWKKNWNVLNPTIHLNNVIDHNTYRISDRRSAGQQTPRLSCNLMVYYSVHNDSILNSHPRCMFLNRVFKVPC